ncbi:hypothetical protein ACOCEA_16475 [Maribacter sp. CXY002]|uniref:hypothetical protein n=1 Tax=Maribacter luteocoastalis TaxID=3407671 RepID=UPI003B682FC6
MRSIFNLISVLIVCSFGSCKSQNNTAANQSLEAYQMELILEDNYGGSEVEETFFIKDQKSLEDLYGKINRTRKPGFPLPIIDFKKHMLFVYNAGKGNHENCTLSLLKITKDTMVISVLREKNEQRITAIVQPFKIFKLPISKRKIILE